MEAHDDLLISQFVAQTIKRWPVILGLGLLGALVGYIFSLFRPPVYQAKAVLGMNIHYGVTEPLELVVEDRVFNRVAGIVISDSTLDQTLRLLPESLRLERGWTEPGQLYQTLRLEQRLAQWNLTATDQDPEVAFILAQSWTKATLAVLDETYEHAWQAAALMGEDPFNLNCTQVLAPEGSPVELTWECIIEPVNLDQDALTGLLQQEIALSRGMLPNISYELLREATVPSEPIVWARGPLILSGAMVGLLIGFLSVIFTRQGITRR
jgi:hypothetical protein